MILTAANVKNKRVNAEGRPGPKPRLDQLSAGIRESETSWLRDNRVPRSHELLLGQHSSQSRPLIAHIRGTH